MHRHGQPQPFQRRAAWLRGARRGAGSALGNLRTLESSPASVRNPWSRALHLLGGVGQGLPSIHPIPTAGKVHLSFLFLAQSICHQLEPELWKPPPHFLRTPVAPCLNVHTDKWRKVRRPCPSGPVRLDELQPSERLRDDPRNLQSRPICGICLQVKRNLSMTLSVCAECQPPPAPPSSHDKRRSSGPYLPLWLAAA